MNMTVYGWLFMIGAWGAIIALNVYCFSLIFREKKTPEMNSSSINKKEMVKQK